MIERKFKVTLKLEGPFMTKGTTVGNYGVDAVPLRDRDGHPILPGSQVKGRLRDSLEELDTVGAGIKEKILDWFGPPVKIDETSPEAGHRLGAWYFSDFACNDVAFLRGENNDGVFTRIRMNSETGTVAKGAMLVIEEVAKPGQPMVFEGAISVRGADKDDAKKWIERGLCWITTFGSYRGVGFGRLIDVNIIDAEAPTGHQHSAASGTEYFALDLRLDAPFCTGERRSSRNILTSVSHLSGAVLKGAVALQLARQLGLAPRLDLATKSTDANWGKLCEHFTNVRFLTAFPTKGDTWPTVRPLSLVLVKEGSDSKKHFDAALIPGAFLFKGKDGPKAPAFSTDWKDDDYPKLASEPAEPRKEIRMHTAIDPNQRRVLKEHLYGHELIHSDGLIWRGAIDLHRVPKPDRATVRDQLVALLNSTELRIGKTKAPARATMIDATRLPTSPVSGKQWVLTLQSAAILVDPFALAGAWKEAGTDLLEAALKKYFDSVSNSELKLIRFFADQDLRGGYLHYRGAKKQFYNPYLIFTPGSVFVLEAAGEVQDAQPIIDKWHREGLPQPDWALARYGATFETNPFLPEDGFGEIAVNLPCHENMKPPAAEIEVLHER